MTTYVHICCEKGERGTTERENRLLGATWYTCNTGKYTSNAGVHTYMVALGISSVVYALDSSRERGIIRVCMARLSLTVRTHYLRKIVFLPKPRTPTSRLKNGWASPTSYTPQLVTRGSRTVICTYEVNATLLTRHKRTKTLLLLLQYYYGGP